MASIQSSSSSSVATRDARDSRDAIESAAGVFRRNGLGEVVVVMAC
jgi:hypothetical protein